MTATKGDLQTAVAAYLSRIRGCPATVAEIAAAIRAPQHQTSVVLSAVVNGEARPYPIVRSGRAAYRWVHDPKDTAACVAVLAEMIGYVTGADPDQAAQYAGHVIRLAEAERRPR